MGNSFLYTCIKCGHHHAASRSLIGEEGYCKACGHKQLITAPATIPGETNSDRPVMITVRPEVFDNVYWAFRLHDDYVVRGKLDVYDRASNTHQHTTFAVTSLDIDYDFWLWLIKSLPFNYVEESKLRDLKHEYECQHTDRIETKARALRNTPPPSSCDSCGESTWQLSSTTPNSTSSVWRCQLCNKLHKVLQCSNIVNSTERQYISRNVQREVWRRDMGKCVECGTNENLEFDHIIALSLGGSNTVRNIQLLCAACNRKKSNRPPGDPY